jgi:hypothetical protein
MKNCVLFFALGFILLSCQTKKPNKVEKASSDSTKYFSLSAFFQQQIVDVDLRSYNIYLIKELNGKRDSMSIDKEVFKTYAALFLQKDISSPEMHSRFSETVFHDLSTKSYTLNYRAKSVDEPIQNIDILLDENTSLVKRVFVRTETTRKDTSIIEQCNWKADKSFQINRVYKTPSGFVLNEFNYINWNDHKK